MNGKIIKYYRKAGRILKKLAVDSPIITLLVFVTAVFLVYSIMTSTYVDKYINLNGSIIADSNNDEYYIKLDIDKEVINSLTDGRSALWYLSTQNRRYNGQLVLDLPNNSCFVKIEEADIIGEFGGTAKHKLEAERIKVEIPFKKVRLWDRMLESISIKSSK